MPQIPYTEVNYNSIRLEILSMKATELDANGAIINFETTRLVYFKGTSIPRLRVKKVESSNSPFITLQVEDVFAKEIIARYSDNPDSGDYNNQWQNIPASHINDIYDDMLNNLGNY
ncbi:MAG: hypothetical protein RLZZ292_2238 [Bacteroidota bacterium]|jgi:hypothetical protein